MSERRFSFRELRLASLVALLSSPVLAQVPTPEPVTDQETELGKAMYDQPAQRRRSSSPLPSTTA